MTRWVVIKYVNDVEWREYATEISRKTSVVDDLRDKVLRLNFTGGMGFVCTEKVGK